MEKDTVTEDLPQSPKTEIIDFKGSYHDAVEAAHNLKDSPPYAKGFSFMYNVSGRFDAQAWKIVIRHPTGNPDTGAFMLGTIAVCEDDWEPGRYI